MMAFIVSAAASPFHVQRGEQDVLNYCFVRSFRLGTYATFRLQICVNGMQLLIFRV